MSAVHGRNLSILANGYDLSTYLKEAATQAEAELLDGTHFQAADKVFVPGFRDGKLSLSGFYETDTVDADAVDDVFRAALGGSGIPFLLSPEGVSTVGKRAILGTVIEAKYEVKAEVSDLIMSAAEFQASGGLRYGSVLAPLAARTSNSNATSVDNGAASSQGLTACFQVIGATGGGTLTGKVQHSTDNSTWVDLITFASATGRTSEVKSVSGTVNRYLRALWTLTGGSSPSFTFAVAASRLQ